MKKRTIADLILNILIVIFTVIGLISMLSNNSSGQGMLQSAGFKNLKYFTVLSNLCCGAVSLIYLITYAMNRRSSGWLDSLRLMMACAVAITFSVVAFMFGPLYGYSKMYLGSNLEFHLIVPVLAMIDICITEISVPFVTNLYSGIPEFVYGTGYVINIMVNGKGEWPKTNDFYGFMNWGYGVAAVIFVGIIVLAIVFSVVFWRINRRITHISA